MLAQDNRFQESMLPRYSEERARAIVRVMLRDSVTATESELIDAVALYRGARHRELVAMGVCSPTAFDVGWILYCMVVCGKLIKLDGGLLKLAEGV